MLPTTLLLRYHRRYHNPQPKFCCRTPPKATNPQPTAKMLLWDIRSRRSATVSHCKTSAQRQHGRTPQATVRVLGEVPSVGYRSVQLREIYSVGYKLEANWVRCDGGGAWAVVTGRRLRYRNDESSTWLGGPQTSSSEEFTVLDTIRRQTERLKVVEVAVAYLERLPSNEITTTRYQDDLVHLRIHLRGISSVGYN